jgi:predicted ATPase/DNA-binding SARP family transcriptional activator
VEVDLLGPLQVCSDAGEVVPLGSAKLRTLLALLALHPGQVVSADRLVEGLWGEHPPAGTANALQSLVAKLRRALGPDEVVRTARPGYVLDVPADAVDTGRFDLLVDRGRKAVADGNPSDAAAAFRGALALWRGEALADFRYDDWAQAEITRLSEARLAAFEDRVAADLECGRHTEMVGELEAAVAEAPLRERLRGELMLALYRSGRQAEALRMFQDARRHLADELGLEPGPELRRLEVAIAAQDPALDLVDQAPYRARGRPLTNLRPPLTPTIGRDTEVSRVRELVDAHRLVSIVGVGGAGKTRLALEVALAQQPRFADGAWFAELAPLGDPDAIGVAVANALDVPSSGGPEPAVDGRLGRLTSYLAEQEVLIVLDNCEHLITAAAAVAEELLMACPGLRVLTTSREALGLPAEVVWPLAPLSPEDSVALFAARASSVDVGFELTDETAPVVADVCDRLDGMPLAIELAAARVRAFPVSQIAARLDDRFRLLTGGARTALPRHQTLGAVVDWSYDLLFEEERRLFERLSVFAGGWDVEGAEAVCADDALPAADVADLLGRLVDKSLVVAHHDTGRPPYTMLLTLAHYGRERLADTGLADEVRKRHARWFGSLAGRSQGAFCGAGQRAWLQTVAQNRDNLRSAFDYALEEGHADLALTIAGGLGWYWWLAGQADEGLRWLGAALADRTGASPTPEALALTWGTYLRLPAGRLDDPSPAADEVLTAWGRSDDQRGRAIGTFLMAQLHLGRGHSERGRELAAETIRVLSELTDDPWSGAVILFLEGHRAELAGDFALAEANFTEAATALEAIGDEFRRAACMGHLGELAAARGDHAAANEAFTAGAEGLARLGLWGHYVFLIACEANLALQLGDLSLAERLQSDALELARTMSYKPVLALILNGVAARRLRERALLEAQKAAEEALALYREGDIAAGAAISLSILGDVAGARGDPAQARSWHVRAVAEARRVSDPPSMAFALEGLAAAEALVGDAERSAYLFGAADRRRAQTSPIELRASGGRFTLLRAARRADLDAVEGDVRAVLGEATWQRSYTAGAEADLDDLLSETAG